MNVFVSTSRHFNVKVFRKICNLPINASHESSFAIISGTAATTLTRFLITSKRSVQDLFKRNDAVGCYNRRKMGSTMMMKSYSTHRLQDE